MGDEVGEVGDDDEVVQCPFDNNKQKKRWIAFTFTVVCQLLYLQIKSMI